MKKEYRLKKNHEIASIVLKRQRISSEYFIVYYLINKNEISNSELNTQVAISVSKKYGKAFERNKAKRQVREIIRPNLLLLDNKKVVIVVKLNSKNVQYEKLKNDLQTLLKRYPEQRTVSDWFAKCTQNR